MSSLPSSSSKRKAADAQAIIDELPNLRRSTLEAIATSALRSSNEAVWAAEKVLNQKRKVAKALKQHCLRCHENFDPEDPSDCKMEEHDEENGMIESGRSGRLYLYPCCFKSDGSDDYCWVGSHVTDGSEFSTKEKKHWCSEVDDENYWEDREVALKWKKFQKQQQCKQAQQSNACFECHNEDDPCVTCCVCGNAEEAEEEHAHHLLIGRNVPRI